MVGRFISKVKNMNSNPTSGRRGPKPNIQTKIELLKAGTTKFHEVGYAACSVKDIVDIAGVPKGSFYNHFNSKEIFGAEVIDYYFNTQLESLTTFFSNMEKAPIEQLKNYFHSRFIQFKNNGYVQGCMLGNLSLEIADHSQLIRDRIAVHLQTWNQLLENCIQQAQEQQSICHNQSAALLARFILNSWEGALLRMRVEKKDQPFDDFMNVIFNIILI